MADISWVENPVYIRPLLMQDWGRKSNTIAWLRSAGSPVLRYLQKLAPVLGGSRQQTCFSHWTFEVNNGTDAVQKKSGTSLTEVPDESQLLHRAITCGDGEQPDLPEPGGSG